jgi:hypothetical protein
VANEPLNCGTVTVACTLRSIKVTITYRSGSVNRTYNLTTLISNYS